ncbi:error-prone DNA polymerase [Telmatospirillum siberiense]|uniref:Error-prone DNA polymerase n=1 Tax=Telmatospirillum siberiense TaxID=382514 RepID=A0A2N3PY89_9PROT|nr:error-prone DNA polymerase [Telmatospirillum siberiense]PKU25382.1 error-prone DNA polymerase [Telmatospirillum siberiense]
MSRYAELQVTSNFTFLEGASHPDELVTAAAALGMGALGLTDRNSLAGIVRAHDAAKKAGLRLVVGTRLEFTDGASVLCFPTDRAAYGRLTRLLTMGKRRAGKGQCRISRDDLLTGGEGQILVVLPPSRLDRTFADQLRDWNAALPGRCYLAAQRRFRADDERWMAGLSRLADATALPLVATNDVLYHAPSRRPLQDVLRCIRDGCAIAEAGWRLSPHAERHLKSPAEMSRLFSSHPDAVGRTLEIVERCSFSLDELRYEYPSEVADGVSAQERLASLAEAGLQWRYPDGAPDKVRQAVVHELALIADLGYAPYFLTVHDLVRFAESRNILCQGRGSAANSAVCYCLGITSVDPACFDLLFERFISVARNEPPDIDVDFEHERREEVIQYIYAKYGRERAGLTATVCHYRTRSALRDVGKVLGLSEDVVGALIRARAFSPERVREQGLDPAEPTLARTLRMASELTGFPRHLSQHVGGFVMTRGRLDELVPIENAAMEDRTVIEWDKDDLDRLGLLKVDVLALGMLSCIHRAFDLLRRHCGLDYALASVPGDDPAVYAMLSRADAIGVFQVESRAQMNMLPRLKPACFYDLVIEVAIVRPGPIQGDMVHPYLRRRAGKERIDYPSPELERVLGKTLGVPLFQEQAMKLAIVAGGFTPSEADQLRRAMASFRHSGAVDKFREKLVEGMVARRYDRAFAERVFRQIEGFGEYGFPESHAASFAHLTYVSAWLKCHHPAVFACALLNSQPMGFYAPAQLVRDAREHGVPVRPVDVNASVWDCTLETEGGRPPALRLGFRQISGLSPSEALALVAARGEGYDSPHALWRRAGLTRKALEALAAADAFAGLGLGRREALWAIGALTAPPPPLFAVAGVEAPVAGPPVVLPAMSLGEAVVEDYARLRLSLKAHPVALLRQSLGRENILPAAYLRRRQSGRVSVAGLVLVRQRPGSAKGVTFLTLEDETGVINVVVWPDIFERFRRPLLAAQLLRVDGRIERQDAVLHVVAEGIADLSAALRRLSGNGAISVASRDFH